MELERGLEYVDGVIEYRAQMNPDFVRRALENRRERITRPMPSFAKEIIYEAADKHGVSVSAVMSASRVQRVVKCRNEIQYLMRRHPFTPSYPQIGKWLNRDHTSAMWAVACHARDTGAPELTNYDAERVRRRNARMRAYTRAQRLREREAS